MPVGDVYINAGSRANILCPRIAESRKEARRWLAAKVLVRDVGVSNITYTNLSNYMGYGVLCVKSYEKTFGDHVQRFSYPESVSGRLTQKYQISKRMEK